MILGRLIMRLLLVPLGAGVAVCIAVVVVIAAHWNRFTALVADNPNAGDDLMIALAMAGPAIALIISVSALAMMLPAAVGVLVSEAFALRSWIFHAANGGIAAWVGWSTMVVRHEPYDFYNEPLIAVGAGIAAGFAYWLVAGWSAGFWKPVFASRASGTARRRIEEVKAPAQPAD